MKSVIFAFVVYLCFNFQQMFKKLLFSFLLISTVVSGQNNQQWGSYFSYNRITDLSYSANMMYASSENAYFTKGFASNDMTTFNSVNGLKTDEITAMYRSETYNITFVGNKSGLVLLVQSDGKVLQKRGIIDEVPVSPVIKKVNHFLEVGNKIYISCDYGISVFDMVAMEFANTYYIGPSGEAISVAQTAVLNGFLYAATRGNNAGIRRISLTNQFMDDFTQWQDISFGGFWNGVITFGNNIYAITSAINLLKYDGTTASFVGSFPETLLDIRTDGNHFTITTAHHIYVYNQAAQQIVHVQSNQVAGDPVTFSCALAVGSNLFIGTNERGVLASALNNPLALTETKPDGPFLNNIFRVKKSSSALYALYGRYTRTYNPYSITGLWEYPISKFNKDNGWSMIPYSALLGAASLSSLAFSPGNENEMYVSSYHDGVLKVVNDVPTIRYTPANTQPSGLQEAEPLPPPNISNEGVRINGPVFDRNGNMWVTNNFVDKALKVRRANGNWQSYDLSAIIPETRQESYGVLTLDKNGTKWLPSSRNGLIAYNDQVNRSMVFKTESNGNLPDGDVRCVAVDNRNQLWIGTAKGLRIIQSVDQFLSEDDLQTKSIIISEEIDGEVLAQELFYEQFIIDIAVDGANRKWVSTAESGVYLVSPNGQQTIYHFTKENSPLPSNIVNDIEVDGVTGEVFFATENGLVSFKGTATKPSEDLSGVYVYPNPVRPEFAGTVKISGLTDRANVKIADIEGNLVYETTSSGGTIEWDTSAFGKYRVASGVYMIFIATQDGADTKVKKVMIVR